MKALVMKLNSRELRLQLNLVEKREADVAQIFNELE